jgi:hypothetical protein
MSGHEASGSYYGRPILKEPVWKPQIPFYFFTGGLSGASAILSLAARLTGKRRLARTSLAVAVAGDLVSPVLLITDLGRPERFLNMLRVFKVSSPMSVGSWILAANSGASGTAFLCDRLRILPRLRIFSEVAAAVAGAPLAVYTATLVSDTAVPVWHEARRDLPRVFGAGAAASAGAAATLLLSPRDAKAARRLAICGAAASELAAHSMEKRLGFLGEPYRQGEAGKYRRVSRAATVSGAALLAAGGRRRRSSALGSLLVLGGEIALRWSVFKAGFQSAADPAYVVRPQRERIAARSGGKADTGTGGDGADAR